MWGQAGSGKTEYLKIFKQNSIKNIVKINDLNEIENEGIYLFDATNESKDFSEDIMEEIIKENKVFIIYSGWESSKKYSDHNINPSDKFVLLQGWDKLKKYDRGNNFSIREKTLMCQIKNFEEIKEKEFHSIIWKAFENVMTKKEIKYYKKNSKNKSFTNIEKWQQRI